MECDITAMDKSEWMSIFQSSNLQVNTMGKWKCTYVLTHKLQCLNHAELLYVSICSKLFTL